MFLKRATGKHLFNTPPKKNPKKHKFRVMAEQQEGGEERNPRKKKKNRKKELCVWQVWVLGLFQKQ